MLRGETLTVATELAVEQCCNCGMTFAITSDFKKDRLQRRRGDMTFYCPRGHPQHYLGESEETRLRRERDALKQREAYLEERRTAAEEAARHEAARARGYKGHAAKVTKRARAGRCVCCREVFDNVRAHMESEHPGFSVDEPETSHE